MREKSRGSGRRRPAAIIEIDPDRWKTCSGLRPAPTTANGQPAFAVYARDGAEGPFAAHSIHVLALEDDMISTLTLFVPPTGPRLFHAFGLPLSLPDAGSAELPPAPHHS